jgi:hypothetical protein
VWLCHFCGLLRARLRMPLHVPMLRNAGATIVSSHTPPARSVHHQLWDPLGRGGRLQPVQQNPIRPARPMITARDWMAPETARSLKNGVAVVCTDRMACACTCPQDLTSAACSPWQRSPKTAVSPGIYYFLPSIVVLACFASTHADEHTAERRAARALSVPMAACGRMRGAALGVVGSHYVTNRQVAIEDARLSLIHECMRVLVVAYVIVVQMVLNHRYAEFETPSVYANIWPAGPAGAGNTRSHCSNAEYDWALNFTEAETAITGGYKYGPSSPCRPYARSLDSIVGDQSFTAVTATFEDTLDANGTVLTSRQLYTDEPETATFNMIHVFSTTWLPNGVVNARTIVRNKAGDVIAQFGEGELVTGVSVGKWLAFAGVSLDDRNIQPWLRGGALAEMPHYRSTGVVLLLRLQYTNLRPWEAPGLGIGAPLCEITVERLPIAWGLVGATKEYDADRGPLAVTRIGVKLQLVHAGSVGRADAFTIIMRLVEATVLLAVAGAVTDRVARYWLYRDTYHSVIVSNVPQSVLMHARASSVRRLPLPMAKLCCCAGKRCSHAGRQRGMTTAKVADAAAPYIEPEPPAMAAPAAGGGNSPGTPTPMPLTLRTPAEGADAWTLGS